MNLWSKEKTNKICDNNEFANNANTPSDCQATCKTKSPLECIGISYRQSTRLYCYLCKDDTLRDSIGFDFYRKPGIFIKSFLCSITRSFLLLYHYLSCALNSFLQIEFNNWRMAENTRCSDANSESGIETLVECQTLCLQNNNCVGVSFSTYWATHSESLCYLCNNYYHTKDVYYDYYQRPGEACSH